LRTTHLQANEVVLVNNAHGILSADPALVRNARVLPRIDMKTLTGIADTGTKFFHRKALRFKDPNINIRVISNTIGRLDSQGTLVTGASIPELEDTIHNPHPMPSMTILVKELPHHPALVYKISNSD